MDRKFCIVIRGEHPLEDQSSADDPRKIMREAVNSMVNAGATFQSAELFSPASEEPADLTVNPY